MFSCDFWISGQGLPARKKPLVEINVGPAHANTSPGSIDSKGFF